MGYPECIACFYKGNFQERMVKKKRATNVFTLLIKIYYKTIILSIIILSIAIFMDLMTSPLCVIYLLH